MSSEPPIRFGFVCVQNAGRSQMATAFAERERERRGLGEDLAIVTGGTLPAEAVHGEVIEAMADLDIDLSDRAPREISEAELESCTAVATMGCSTLDLDAETDVRDWDLPDPDGKDPEEVRAIRDEIANRVEALFDEYFAEIEPEQ
ncbi:arsenate-mycothiol transferase ArsC [Halalkalicoccus jeotgali]|uniref:Protein-tyrosine phosphatase, low molecular weight n=1 Tax=Halalkalicoccus jeotgali (strain DSM 18796 / CECT 7217 / JCM 14584 / KCTC 4019 / B3) TaxID=795797 RepID=D8JAM8_HALJB|nr:low molecular weight phosphatase family protein [Halalkalicoccus jeotgali]ADJ14750.1 Protein-tyrosine phosphatase, low molecular weight [Halalkalicoccus jeotgali B3]ELY39332.1 Protein-tyrosine phosphatase, low molecular weight [Halalkalicoccus jeotgali B3]